MSKGAAKHAREMGSLSQWQLIRLRFRRHKLAIVSMYLLIVFYLMALFADFFAPYNQSWKDLDFSYCPPQIPGFNFTHGLHVYAQRLQVEVVYKKRMLFCIFSCTNSVRQFILSAWLLKLLIVGTVEVKISLNLARRPTINSATAAMIVVNKAAKTPQ